MQLKAPSNLMLSKALRSPAVELRLMIGSLHGAHSEKQREEHQHSKASITVSSPIPEHEKKACGCEVIPAQALRRLVAAPRGSVAWLNRFGINLGFFGVRL